MTNDRLKAQRSWGIRTQVLSAIKVCVFPWLSTLARKSYAKYHVGHILFLLPQICSVHEDTCSSGSLPNQLSSRRNGSYQQSVWFCWHWPTLMMTLWLGTDFNSQSRKPACHSPCRVHSKSLATSSTFVVALLTSCGPHPRCPPAEESVKKLIYVHSGISLSHEKKIKIIAVCRKMDTTGDHHGRHT